MFVFSHNVMSYNMARCQCAQALTWTALNLAFNIQLPLVFGPLQGGLECGVIIHCGVVIHGPYHRLVAGQLKVDERVAVGSGVEETVELAVAHMLHFEVLLPLVWVAVWAVIFCQDEFRDGSTVTVLFLCKMAVLTK